MLEERWEYKYILIYREEEDKDKIEQACSVYRGS